MIQIEAGNNSIFFTHLDVEKLVIRYGTTINVYRHSADNTMDLGYLITPHSVAQSYYPILLAGCGCAKQKVSKLSFTTLSIPIHLSCFILNYVYYYLVRLHLISCKVIWFLVQKTPKTDFGIIFGFLNSCRKNCFTSDKFKYRNLPEYSNRIAFCQLLLTFLTFAGSWYLLCRYQIGNNSCNKCNLVYIAGFNIRCNIRIM